MNIKELYFLYIFLYKELIFSITEFLCLQYHMDKGMIKCKRFLQILKWEDNEGYFNFWKFDVTENKGNFQAKNNAIFKAGFFKAF